MPDSFPPELSGAMFTVDFIRHRNALLVRADLCPLFTDYYLHLADYKLHYSPEQAAVFRDALAAFALHCASRPLYEHIAWTINLQQPLVNIFLAGDNEDCTITGRLFTENVKEAAQNFFFSDSLPRRGAETHRSVVNFTGPNVFAAVQAYYRASEQRPVRYFHAQEDEFAMLVSHPDCDLAWFNSAERTVGPALLQSETLARIDGRVYRWHCGCTQQKILGAIAPAFRADPEGVFGDGESIRVQCPRCAATHALTREAMEAYLAQSQKG